MFKKIELNKTKITTADGQPMAVYHATQTTGGIDEYMPLSHFGTSLAAEMRAYHLMLKSQNKQTHLMAPNPKIKLNFTQFLTNLTLPPISVQKVFLSIRHPLKMPDLSSHNIYFWQDWFLKSYLPKKQFLSRDEIQESLELKPNQTQYKQALTDFIFKDPKKASPQQNMNELNAGKIWTPKMIQSIKDLPLSVKVSQQRLIRFLMGEGYDGFSYTNTYEDQGKTSYIIMHPSQVFNALDQQSVHSMPTPTADDQVVLKTIESDFFQKLKTPGPSERIDLYNISSKEQKNRLTRQR